MESPNSPPANDSKNEPYLQTGRPIRTIRDLKLKNQAVFLRLDLNVPLGEPDASGHRPITDDTRIREALPTIRYALEQGAKLVIASHLGRPKGKPLPEFSLEPVALHLAQELGQEVTLADDCVGEGIELMIQGMKAGQVLLLENLRFHGQEEANDPVFCRKLARLADTYVTDAFGTAHRRHASTFGLPGLMKKKAIGFLIEKELKYLQHLTQAPKKPFYIVLGGAKVADKIKAIETLMRHVDGIAIGGAMAYAFLRAKDEKIPETALQPSPDGILAAQSILREAKKRDIPVILPIDHVDGADVGPQTIEKFCNFLADAKTIFWNGPVGWFEKPNYAHGTFELAKFIGALSATKVVGGGDTVAAIRKAHQGENFDHLSTGGGAVLEFLEQGGLPGLEVLRDSQKTESITL